MQQTTRVCTIQSLHMFQLPVNHYAMRPNQMGEFCPWYDIPSMKSPLQKFKGLCTSVKLRHQRFLGIAWKTSMTRRLVHGFQGQPSTNHNSRCILVRSLTAWSRDSKVVVNSRVACVVHVSEINFFVSRTLVFVLCNGLSRGQSC